MLNGDSISVSKFFQRDLGFLIPSFQRDYSWQEEDLKRFLETIETVISNNLNEQNNFQIGFLGSIITVSDQTEIRQTYTIAPNESPNEIKVIIDGQQRLTTLLLLFSIFYKEISLLSNDAEFLQNFASLNIQGFLGYILEDLKTALFIPNPFAIQNPQLSYLPKLISQLHGDEWKRNTVGTYNSPIAKFLFTLFQNPNPTEVPQYSLLVEGLKELQTKFQNNGILSSIYTNYQAKFLNGNSLPNQVNNFFQEEKLFRFLFYYVLFYVVWRYVFFIEISVAKHDLAFDIFDVLNTTGLPLTAMETFRPIVIQELRQQQYNGSNTEEYLDSFFEYLAELKISERQKFSKDFVVSLALYESGKEVGELLSEQRKYLREHYTNECDNPQLKENFCKSIKDLTTFYEDVWDSIPNDISDEAKLCLDLLKSTNHSIVIPLLARYYHEYRNPDQLNLFSNAIKAVTIFSFYWRILHSGSTAGIDDIYRGIMSKLKVFKNSQAVELQFLKDTLKGYLKHKLGELTETNFVNQIRSMQYQNAGRKWINFFFVVAYHHTQPDPQNPGLEIRAVERFNSTIEYNKWRNHFKKLTIEHIAPQNPDENTNWSADLLLPQNLHSIGNFTLMPSEINKTLGNKEWILKRKFFNILSESNIERRRASINEFLAEHQLRINQTTRRLLETQYTNFCGSLASVENWNANLIQRRAERLASLVWQNTSDWLL